MKTRTLILAALGIFSLTMQAQDDDMYFVTSKKNVDRERASYGMPTDTYYSGSDRSVDEYNRRGGSPYGYVSGDSTMNDVISFSGERGVYPDSTADFAYTRQMSRWDGYTPADAYWEGYDQGRSDEWAASTWHSPWFYTSYYPWYDSWYYRPYSWRYTWYDPWYYRNYSWGWGGYYSYRPYYRHYTSGYPRSSRGRIYAGTRNHSINRGTTYSGYGGSGRSGISSRTTTGVRSSLGTSSSTRRSVYTGNVRSSSSTGSSSSSTSTRSGGTSSWSSGSSRSSGSSFGGHSSGGSRGGGFSGSRGGGGGRSGGRR